MRIFLTGPTGYIGGAVLDGAVGAAPELTEVGEPAVGPLDGPAQPERDDLLGPPPSSPLALGRDLHVEQAALGAVGLGGDERLVFGAESDGRLVAWQRASGQQAWSVDRLKHRELGAPTALGRVVAIGDATGLVHLVSREDGAEMARLVTDGSPVLSAPLLAGSTLVVQTRKGGLYAWRPQ